MGTERAGAGVVLSSCGGLILTAYYLLIGADRVQIECLDGRTLEGRVFGVDYATGLGIIAPVESGLSGLVLAPAGELAAGREAFMVASTGEERPVATGFAMNVGPFDALWEFVLDAAIYFSAPNPGLGGGPLLDMQGRVAGIAALSMVHAGRPTVVFPAAGSLAMIDAIAKDGVYRAPIAQGWLGLTSLTIGTHVAVSGIFPGSAAEGGGLVPGDRILQFQGHGVVDRATLYRRVQQAGSGTEIALQVRRGEHLLDMAIRTGSVESYFA